MQEEEAPLTWDDIPHVHTLSLALGYRLVHLVNKDQGAPLAQRIRGFDATYLNKSVFYCLKYAFVTI